MAKVVSKVDDELSAKPFDTRTQLIDDTVRMAMESSKCQMDTEIESSLDYCKVVSINVHIAEAFG